MSPPPTNALRHVALLAHSFPPDGNAGVEQYTLRLAQQMLQRGLRVSVVCARVRAGAAQNSVLREDVQGVPVFGLVQNWPYRDMPEAASDPGLDRAFGVLLDELAPDLLAIQTLQGLSWGLPAVAAARGVRVVLHLHDAFASCASGGQRLHPDGTLCLPVDPARCGGCFDRFRHREGPLERASRWAAARLPSAVPPDALHRAFGAMPERARDGLRMLNARGARLAQRGETGAVSEATVDPRIVGRREVVGRALTHVHRVLSPSRFLAESVAADGVSLPDVRIVPSGVSPGPQVPWRRGSKLRLLFLGTWVEHKGPHVLADALALLDDSVAARVDARAHGPVPFPAYRSEVRRRAAGRLSVGGPIESRGVGAAIGACDVVVVPSVWAENAPLVVLEARACGRPVLASDLGGLIELVEHDVDGLRFPAGDSAALAACVTRLVQEPDLLGRLQGSVRPPASEEEWGSAILRAWTAP